MAEIHFDNWFTVRWLGRGATTVLPLAGNRSEPLQGKRSADLICACDPTPNADFLICRFTKLGESLTVRPRAMHELFSERLRKWRGKLYQKEAAALLDVPVATLRKWEYGKQTPHKLALAEIERRMQRNGEMK